MRKLKLQASVAVLCALAVVAIGAIGLVTWFASQAEEQVRRENSEIVYLACQQALVVGASAAEIAASAPPVHARAARKILRSATQLHQLCQNKEVYLPGDEGYYLQSWANH